MKKPPDLNTTRVRRDTIAGLLKITPRQVNRLVKNGTIPAPDENHLYHLRDCLAGYHRMLRENPPSPKATPSERAALAVEKGRLPPPRPESPRSTPR